MANITEKELEFLFPETEVEIAGHVFTIKPFSFVETKIVAEKLKNVLHLIPNIANENGEVFVDVLAQMYAVAFDGVRDVVAMCLGIKPELVEKFDQQSALIAISKIIEINKDFFTQQVESEMQGLTKMLGMEDDNSNTEK